MGKFAIRRMVVREGGDRQITKILEPGEYVFTEQRHDDFFMEGITVCSVVGKNGCGKSSLIELLFRMVNNLGAMILRNFDRPAAVILYWVDGVMADLYYDIDGNEGQLQCDRDSVQLSFNGFDFNWSRLTGQCDYKINGVPQKEPDYPIALSVAQHFFYLIATNYSMQAYISDDYKNEITYRWQQKKDQHGAFVEGYEWRKEQSGVWIDSVFHKNDGYMCPIVLNPYRDGGTVDMAQEGRLTVDRLCALLLQMPDDNQIIDGYKLDRIEYRFNQLFLLDKFDRKMLMDIPYEKVSDKFLYAYLMDNSYAKAILDGYEIDATKAMNYVELTLRMYLVYKTFSIAKKYPQYGHYKPIGHVNNAFKSNSNTQELNIAKQLAKDIKGRKSHIELKVHQTLDLIRMLDRTNDKNALDNPLTYDQYNAFLGIEPHCNTVLERKRSLPPPLFKPTVYLRKLSGGDPVELSKLSSGERQFIYTTSTLLYHALNIQSIPPAERLTYKNICMVLDEVEICFHPEYQRTFVNNLLSLFERTGVNKAFNINVIIVTHSPFVLSDIPKGNILYLDEGRNVSEKKKLDTFGANVNEMLCQSFFLDGGFMGELAKKRIKSLVKYLNGDRDEDCWNEQTAKQLIEMVGDELIRYQLHQMYARRFKDSEHYRKWIESEARRLGIGR